MGFLDKAKEQAQSLAVKAQEGVKTGVKAGQEKLEQVQAARKADALLRDLGAAVFLEKSGRGTGTAADVDRLVAELAAHEAEHGPVDLAPKAAAAAAEHEAPAAPEAEEG